MTLLLTLKCVGCGAAHSDTLAAALCPSCGGILAAIQPSPPARGQALAQLFDSRVNPHALRGAAFEQSGVWRFRELVLPCADDAIVSIPEGNTPLIASPAVAEYAGVPSLRLKHEGMNPTCSFKDRGMTVAITQAKRIGATAVACASTGNTSSSMAAYAARAGIRAIVIVPKGKVALGKLAQTCAYGATTLLVRGDFDDCMRLAREAAQQLGVYLANSLNPFRIEGQKTIVFELLQQSGWIAPDWIAIPAGNLGNTAAFGKALVEAHTLGLIDRVPRLLCVQAAGAAPFAHGFADGFAARHKVKPETLATAIRIGDPASWDRGVESIRATNGVVVSVDDPTIMEAKSVIDAAGVGCEPASAASVAGVRILAQSGQIARGERVVSVLTGHLLKDPSPISPDSNGSASRVVEIDPTIAAIAAAIRD